MVILYILVLNGNFTSAKNAKSGLMHIMKLKIDMLSCSTIDLEKENSVDLGFLQDKTKTNQKLPSAYPS